MKCIKCFFESDQEFNSCPSCGVIISEYMAVDEEIHSIQIHRQRRLLIAGFIGLLVIVFFTFFWFLISNNKGPHVVNRHNQLTNRKTDAIFHAAKLDTLPKPKMIKENQIKAVYLKGVKYGLQGHIYRAKEQFLTILEKHPDYKPANTALQLIDSVIEETGENPGLTLYFQGILLQEGNQSKDKAAAAYKQSALYFKDRGQSKFAIDILDKAISINPEDAQLHFDIGIMSASKRLWNRAELAFSKAVKIEPTNRDAIIKLGLLYGLQGKLDNAIQTLQIPVLSKDKDGEIDFHLAVAYFYKKDFDLSKRYADRALQLGYKVNPVLITKLNKYIKK